MNIHQSARILLTAGMLAASVLGGSAGQVHALGGEHNTKASCEAAGYEWDAVKGCADQYCLDNLHGYGDPGESEQWVDGTGRSHSAYCDGWSGQWVEIGRIQTGPGGPSLPVVGSAGLTQTTTTPPTHPVLPHPVGTGTRQP